MGILEEILTEVHANVRYRENIRPLAEIKTLASKQLPPRDVYAILRQNNAVTIIGEIKRSMPGYGKLAEIPDPAALALQYQEGGTAMVAVHTEYAHYRGTLNDLKQIRQVIDLPILHKDFILTPYQVHESRALGADMLLFIVECLPQTVLTSLVERCHSLGMTALVEVHSRLDALRALEAGAKAIAVNGHDLRNLTENVENFAQIIDVIPKNILTIAEFGVKQPRDIFSYAKEGADAILIGEAFVTAAQPKRVVSEMVAAGVHPSLPASPRKRSY